ncbi:MAG: FapA family protein [Pseudomonadota bacterium]
MRGITLKTIQYGSKLEMSADPLLCKKDTKADELAQYLAASEYAEFIINHQNLQDLCDDLDIKQQLRDINPIVSIIGVLNVINPEISIAEDGMQATLSLHTKSGDKTLSTFQVIEALRDKGVVRGVSTKAIDSLLVKTRDAQEGTVTSAIVAKGLPARPGKHSYIKPLVSTALARLLKHQESEKATTDIQKLADAILVTPGQAVAQRIPPTKGRAGYTVTDRLLTAEPGQWKDIELGDNTQISENNENIIVSVIAGQPKFDNACMSILEMMFSKGVSAATENIDYSGSVLIDGDVTEDAQIIATGDVIINGFVESSLIRAGGDILITQGATGQMEEYDCQLFANGNIIVHHGQGLDIVCGKHLQALKQLAYSKIVCHGRCTIGLAQQADGAFFASSIKAYDTVEVGIAGAVSGSALDIDFTDGYRLLTDRLTAVTDLSQELLISSDNHEQHVKQINKKLVPQHLLSKIEALDSALASQRLLLNWMLTIKSNLQKDIENYRANARLIALSELYPGVTVNMGKQRWQAEREYLSSNVRYENDQWIFEEIT